MKHQNPHFLLLCFIPLFPSCFKVLQDQTSTKQITAISLELPSGAPLDTTQVSVRILTDSIYITVPANTNLNSLIPIITSTGAVLAPANGVPEDFTNPVTYLVTAQNGTTQSYVVVVTE